MGKARPWEFGERETEATFRFKRRRKSASRSSFPKYHLRRKALWIKLLKVWIDKPYKSWAIGNYSLCSYSAQNYSRKLIKFSSRYVHKLFHFFAFAQLETLKEFWFLIIDIGVNDVPHASLSNLGMLCIHWPGSSLPLLFLFMFFAISL